MKKPGNFRIGIRLPDWNRGYGNRLFGGIRDFIQEGHSFELEFDQPSAGYFEPIRIDENWQGDGLLVYRYNTEEARAWRKRGISVVNLSAEQPDSGPRFPRVTLDNENAGELAAEHLSSLGAPQFAFWHDPSRKYSEERLAGFQEGLSKRNFECTVVEVPASMISGRRRFKLVSKAVREGILRLQKPCGFFAKDDLAGVSTIRALKDLNIRCSEEIAVLGVSDDIVHCHLSSPALSSLRFPGKKLGYTAAKLLNRLMNGEDISEEFRIQIASPGVVPRESTEHIDLQDRIVSEAMLIIRKEACAGNLTVHDLCDRLEASRELVRQKFQETFGRSVKQEIDRVRCANIADLLRKTDWPQERIAEICSFSGGDELCRFFKRVWGTTPSNWRKLGLD